MEKIDIAIIGGGVIGLACAGALSKDSASVFLFEKNPYLGDEQSGRNSGVIHAGIYYDKMPLKRKLCVEGNRLLYEFCEKHGVPCRRTGKLIVATDEEEDRRLDFYLESAKKAGAEGIKKITSKEVALREPNVRAYSALLSPSTGILDAASYVDCLSKIAAKNDVEIMKKTKVTGIKAGENLFAVEIENSNGEKETFAAETVINAAGLYSDEIAKMINPVPGFEIIPVRGEYYYFNTSKRADIKMNGTNVYPVQKPYYINGAEHLAIGIHLTPAFELNPAGEKVIGNKVLVGPTTSAVGCKDDLKTGRKGPEYFYGSVRKFFPCLKIEDLQADYAGIRAKLKDGEDFVIERDEKHHNAVNLIGIDSPGLTASLAIAKFVKNLLIG
ncbi:MAG: NAD(P)/FAD-dependent oxidoreductase [bacterium]